MTLDVDAIGKERANLVELPIQHLLPSFPMKSRTFSVSH